MNARSFVNFDKSFTIQSNRICYIEILRDIADKLMLINIWQLLGNEIEGFIVILRNFHARLDTTKHEILDSSGKSPIRPVQDLTI